MNNKPQQVLCDLIAKYGSPLAEEKSRCSGLLRDHCCTYKAEINVLITAMEEQVPGVLTNQTSSAPADVVITRLVKRLRDDRGLTEENARWAVESWALALGVIQSVSVSPARPPPPFYKPSSSQPQPTSRFSQPATKAWGPTHLIMLVIILIVGVVVLTNEFATTELPAQAKPPSQTAELERQNELANSQKNAAEDARKEAEKLKAQAEEMTRGLQLEVERARQEALAAKVELAKRQYLPVPATPGHDTLIPLVNPKQPVKSAEPATLVQDELIQTIRNYYAALDRRDVSSAISLRKTPPKNFIAQVQNIEKFKVNDARILTAEPAHGSVWVDVVGKTRGASSPERWQGSIGLEPMESGGWGIVSMQLSKVVSEPVTPISGHDDVVAVVREYYAALDRHEADSAIAKWKSPPSSLRGLIDNIEHFKVNSAHILGVESDHASVWVDVSGKTYDATIYERWQGSVELEPMGSGKWGIVAMNLKKT